MTLLNTINVGGTDYGITGAAVLGSCATPAGSEVKVCTFSDNFELKAGDMLLVKFTYANTYGDGSTTYPKLQINGTNYVMRRADGNYLQSGEWGNNATLTFLFDGTDFILPAGSGTGNAGGIPLGTVLAIYTNQVPDGYLPCNGVQFDTAQFAALYALLGDDHTPDLREVTLRGIGHNGTYVFDSTETNPNTGLAGTQNHDEYSLGEFKDDQLQNITGNFESANRNRAPNTSGVFDVENGSENWFALDTQVTSPTIVKFNASRVARAGTVTRGKSVGVNYIIKATSGLPDEQQDYILNQINVQRSYSTTEHPTGKKWIDGKPIYSKTFYSATGWTNAQLVGTIADFDRIMSVNTAYTDVNNNSSCNYSNPTSGAEVFTVYFNKTSNGLYTVVNNINMVEGYITIEYTKTTPST